MQGAESPPPAERYLVFRGTGEAPMPGHPAGEAAISIPTLGFRFSVPVALLQDEGRSQGLAQEGVLAWFRESTPIEWEALTEEGRTPSGAAGGIHEVMVVLKSQDGSLEAPLRQTDGPRADLRIRRCPTAKEAPGQVWEPFPRSPQGRVSKPPFVGGSFTGPLRRAPLGMLAA